MNRSKTLFLATALLIFSVKNAIGQDSYKMQPVTIQSRWAKDVSPANALKEYPRPQLTREHWTNLNGLWRYAITEKGAVKPKTWEGQILVPYPIESALSGVKKSLLPTQTLWYKRSFDRPKLKPGEKLKLNFGAVDYEAAGYINGTLIGSHTGGYTEFSFDITPALKEGTNELVVKMFDPSNEGIGPHGKQVSNPAMA
ncbi:sugar-binding domain-containing protein [Pedobacter sp. JY14-1]|uniref:sugar-binding domain-containing protein n=1 Tax=Pedobacter sp. JY14-1 TaxID=3034151 RepID=UPI0023E2EE63|nr:sugar-binding domain-containing protein [Pedobacter sp. JY14-1]